MRQIRFISPVESIQGNLSGAQKLVYPTHDNSAYEAPLGKSYARNYKPRFIGCMRQANGRTFYAVKTKFAVNITAQSKLQMAIMAGAGAIYAAISRDSTLSANLLAAYEFATSGGAYTGTIRQFAMSYLMYGITAKSRSIRIGIGSQSFTVDNPWSTTSSSPNIIVSTDVLVKYWGELALNGKYFKVDNMTGICIDGMTFATLASNTRLNILGIEIADVEGTQRPQINSITIVNQPNGSPCLEGMIIANHGPYTLRQPAS